MVKRVIALAAYFKELITEVQTYKEYVYIWSLLSSCELQEGVGSK